MKKKCLTVTMTLLLLLVLVPEGISAAGFNDVAGDAWYAGPVAYCYQQGYMAGVGDNNFAPEFSMTRAMLATVLYRAAGEPAVTGTVPFADAAVGSWYSDAVIWGADQQIIAGYEDGSFRPNQNVSRQELTVFLCRYLDAIGKKPDNAVNTAIYDSFADQAGVGAWAQTSMCWCASVGIVGGSDGYLNPQASSTRAQIATVLQRLDRFLANDTYTITATAGSHGSVSPAGTFTLVNGAALSFGFTAEKGYLVDDVKVDGVSQGYTLRQTVSLGGNRTLAVSFKKLAGNPGSGYAQLVNRSYPIANAASYVPNNLINVNYANGTQKMQGDAATAMNSMLAAFKKAYPNLPIIAQSGYRSYATQQSLYTNQISKQGGNKYKAGTVSAIPGTSEHQLGLAMDLSTDGTLLQSFGSTTQGKWFAAHCGEYGFILRYPLDKQIVTGIIYEPWHFRYVGVAVAAEMKKLGVTTLEEYYGLYLSDADLSPYLPYLK